MAKRMSKKKESRAFRPCSEEVWEEERRKGLRTTHKGFSFMFKAILRHPLTVGQVNRRIGIELCKGNLCLLTR